ncbi:hypothetical protein K490DRAFT_51194 [Saccharata proteae CBS 121410]|uniref:CUE domain-containing protein n=1 Tax=Saccharata proteae CBS 121410 TaxID=1314787 RepID=A0A9P4HMN2_9PEZI|nr:hypothetical protein K490DRAFT_51194 [Saccharata proteae CBS 121410]
MPKAPESGSVNRSESPTTARELDFDDDSTQDTSAPGATSPPPKPRVSFQDVPEEIEPPPKPPRPLSPMAQAENTLIEAFPNTDPKVVKAVLVASGGKVEPAFNALLSMSDPSFKIEDVPPPQPPRPTAAQRQLEQDELYARQLAEHFQAPGRAAGSDARGRGGPQSRGHRTEEDEKEYSFFDDDLPEIKENIRKGFVETQSKVNKWITDFRKKIDGDEDEDHPARAGSSGQYQRQNFGPSQSEQLYGIRKSAEGRRSGDRERYDADPHVLSDDFSALEMRDNDTPPNRTSSRPAANPNLFKPTPPPPQSGPVDEVEALYRQPTRQPSPGANKTKKWQPLTSVAPNPEVDDHDPFSLGDSDDEQDVKEKGPDVAPEASDRLKKTVSQSGRKASVADEAGVAPREAERSGSVGQIDKKAQELLSGKKE